MSRPKHTNRLRLEYLEARTLFAAVDFIGKGGSCPADISNVAERSVSVSAEPTVSALPYSYSLIGNKGNAAVSPTPGLAMMGGGTNVDAAFAWLAGRANKGDFVVLSASKNDYGRYINGLATLDSVESLVVPDRAAANHSTLATIIENAEAIFITGGDQSNYIKYWANTVLETAIYTAMARGAALGGSSAGLAVMGQVDYAALTTSTTSAEALANWTTPSITLDTAFLTPIDRPGTLLDVVHDTVTDSHFMQRDRMGRTMAFMANADAKDMVSGLPRGIAINEQTALLVDASGIATVVGNRYGKTGTRNAQQRSVYMFSAPSPVNLVNGSSLSYEVQAQRLNYNPLSTGTSDTFNLNNWSGTGVDVYTVIANNGVLSSTSASVYGPIIA